MRPNLLWVVLDTARADALEPHGAAPGSSPALADLARSGLVVEGVRATAPWTLPSHVSMFSGALPRGLGLGQAPAKTPQSAAPVVRAQAERMLPEVLRRSGYATAAISTNTWVSPLSGFDVGFEDFVSLDSSRQGRLDGGTRQRAGWALEAIRARADDGAAAAARAAARLVDGPPPRPFFWFVNLLECHSPYLPPRPYAASSALERLRAAEDARRFLTLEAIMRACTGNLEVPAQALARMRRMYAACVRYLDDWLGTLLSRLEDAGLLGDTLVVVCSDHGENLGEGGLLAHALSLDERLLRVPFIAAGPGAEAFAGMRSLAEAPERVARAIGIEDHPWQDGGLPAGLPVAQFDPLAPSSDPAIEALVRSWGADATTTVRLTTPLTSAVDGRWKLVRRGAAEEVYDLEADPLEGLPRRAEELLSEAGDSIPRLRAALDHPTVVASASHDAATPAPEELEAIEDRMRLLGYM
jgi:Sulfatase